MKKSFLKKLLSKMQGNIRSKILISLLCLTFLMMLYTSLTSFRLASSQISKVSLRLSESNTAAAVSALDKKLESIYDWTTQFIALPELQQLAKQDSVNARDEETCNALQQSISTLQTNAMTADVELGIISAYLKNGYTYSVHSTYSLPFYDYDSCLSYFREQGQELPEGYTTPKWLLCTAQKNGRPVTILMYVRFIYQSGNLDKRGIMVFGVQEKWLSSLYTSFAPNASIVTKEGIVYSASGKTELIGTLYQDNLPLLDLLRNESSDRQAVSLTYTDAQGKEAILSCQNLRQMQAYFVVPFDFYEGIAAEETHSYLRSILVMFVCGLAAAGVLSYVLSHGLSSSISSLKLFVKQVEEGQAELRYEPESQDEIAYLGRQFNQTLDQLQASARQREEDLKANQALELQLNQLQINPHLLYNTLDSALWMLQQENSSDAGRLIESMSEFFKLSLSKGRPLIPLENELTLITHYLNIQKLARQKDIHIEFCIEETLYQHPIIKLTLQPLVENAVVHGFSGYRDDGTIRIFAEHREACIQLEITDNGIGMLPEEVDELNEVLQLSVLPEDFHHFGVFNINRRIVQTYGNAYGLHVESEVGVYTTIHMRLPYTPPPENFRALKEKTIMFKVMIIDDDCQVRNRLKSIIDWEHLPLELVCEAADSETAMELYLLHRPKIIISDINIPIISGLDLAAILRKEDPELQFIIITGYNDFELVRKSVELGAVDLLSKPILPETINKSLQNVVNLFVKKQQEQSSVHTLTQLVSDNLPQMQEIFMMNLISNPPENVTALEAQFRQLDIPLVGPYYAVVMLAVRSAAASINHEALLLMLRDTLIANLKENLFSVLAYVDSHSRLNCIISASKRSPDNTLEEIFTQTREQLHFTTDTQLFVGIGPTVKTPGLLYESRSGALTALNYQCVLGNTAVMHYKNMEQMDTVFHSQETIQLRLLQLFRENDPDAIEAIIKSHICVLSTYGSTSGRSIQNFLFEYVQGITNEALRLGLTLERINSYVPTVMQLVQNVPDEANVDSVLKLTEQILSCLFQRHTNEGNRLVSIAKAYIQENLGDENLCLESVSDHICLSKIYFCKLFHQVEGISFNAYLKQERIEKAKQLLSNSSLKVFEISDQTGFSNAKYFSFAFKQVTGQTPLEYRQSIE